ncbi:MAG: sulfotransferase domain-containing protein [Rhodospirillales bacterium]|nr:sulfotransferase domain-containing protein [Rhodospirillales bacterium]
MRADRAKPNFLGIGAYGAGSTWLYALLSTHPQVYVPTAHKELHYFAHNFEKGADWYEQFFPKDDDAEIYRAIGDISPGTMYDTAAPARIRDYGSIDKFLVIVREPFARAISSYKKYLQYRRFEGSFERFMETHPEQVEQGLYARYLEPFLQEFGGDRFHIIIFEEAVADVGSAKRELGAFLDLTPGGFPDAAGQQEVNVSRLPRLPGAYAFMVNASRKLQDMNMYWLINLGHALGLKSALLGGRTIKVSIDDRISEHYRGLFRASKSDLEQILGRRIPAWAT